MRRGVAAPAFLSPVPITSEHRLDGFECGKPPLDKWLKVHALGNEAKASRTFVVADTAMNVQAFYTLATGSVTLKEVPRRIRQGLPNPVPVMMLGRLAVDQRFAGCGIGPALLREAMVRTIRVAREAGVRAMIVHAIDDAAVNFYAKYGFQIFPPETRTLFLPVETILAALAV